MKKLYYSVYGYSIQFSQLSLERDLIISELVESPSVGLEEVGGASEEGEVASTVGRLIGLLGVSSSSLGADLLRTLEGRERNQYTDQNTVKF